MANRQAGDEKERHHGPTEHTGETGGTGDTGGTGVAGETGEAGHPAPAQHGRPRFGVPYDSATMQAVAAGTFSLLGEVWDILPGVFLPSLTHATAFFTRRLPYPEGGAFLELGCGAGVTAVHAAKAGCARVLAADADPQATATARRNAARHGAHRLRTATGDAFDAVGPHDGPFDLIFWNLPYFSVPAGSSWARKGARSLVDVDLHCLRACIGGARDHLAPRGRLFLGLGDVSDLTALTTLAEAHGFRPRLVARGQGAPGTNLDASLEHLLYELDDLRTAGR